MRDAVICEPLRTPVGRYGGTLRDVPAADLAATVVKELVRRTGLTGADVDDVIFGQCYPNGEAPAIGRWLRWMPGLVIRFPVCSWTAAAVPAFRPSSTPPCGFRPEPQTW